MASNKIASPLRGWLGGKFRLTSTLIPLIPPHRCYAEVFAGAAWLLFHKPPAVSKAEVLNDINADIVNLYRVVQNHSPELLRQLETMLPARDEYDRLQQVRPENLTDIQRAARFVYLHRLSFGGKVTEQHLAAPVGRAPKFNSAKLADELTRSRARLSGVMLERLNYDDFIRRYDRSDTFFYIDPPYWDCETMYGKGIFGKPDFDKLAAQLAGIKGRFLLSINDKPEIRTIFAAFCQREIRLRYSVSRHDCPYADELLIANYPLPETLSV